MRFQECDRIDGHCGYFYASIVAMIGPFILTAVFILLLKLLRDDDDHDDGCYEYSLMLAAGVFPFYNLWVAILEKCGKYTLDKIVICQHSKAHRQEG